MATFKLDPEYARHLDQLAPKLGNPPKAKVGDIKTRRATINNLWPTLLAQLPPTPDITKQHIANVPSYDGHEVPLYKFSKRGPSTASAIVYTHGGGHFCLSVELYAPLLSTYVSLTGVPIFAMDYRLPPEHPFPAPVEDCFAGLKYVHDNAAELGVDPDRIAVMGDSAGGGLCAGAAILARNREIRLAKHIVINGNLDDRNVNTTHRSVQDLAPFATWGIEDNITGWDAYLGGGHEFKKNVSAPAAPSRLENARGMAPLYLDVPTLDILRDEGVKYAAMFMEQGIDTELHVYPGVPHSFEAFAPHSRIAKLAMQNRARAMTSF